MTQRSVGHSLPLQWKLPLGIGLLVCITASVIGLASYRLARESARDALAARLANMVEQMALGLETRAGEFSAAARAVAANPDVIAFVRDSLPVGVRREPLSRTLPTPDSTTVSRSLWSGAGVLLVADADTLSLAQISPAEITQGEHWPRDSAFVGRFRAVDTTFIVFPVIAPVRAGDVTIGHVVEWSHVSANAVSRDQISGLIGSGGVLYLGSKGGAWTDQVTSIDAPPIDATAVDTMVEYRREGAGRRLARAADVAGLPWVVLIEFPHAAVGLPLSRLMRQVVLIAFVVMLAALLAAWALGRHLARPIRELTTAVQAVHTYSPHAHVDVPGDHDVAQLAVAFNQMADRVGAEAEARRVSEEQWHLLFKSNPQSMWVFDSATYEFLAVNDAATMQYGYTRDEFLAMTIRDIRPDEELARLDAALGAVSTGVGIPADWTHRRKNGSLLQVEVHSHGLVFDGRPARLVLAQDVTQRLALENQLRQAQKMEAVGQLAGGVAHDFNNLLTVIMAYSEMIAEDLAPGEPRRGDIEQVIEASRKAHLLTRQLLAFSRQQVLQPAVLNPNTVIVATGRLLRPLLGETVNVTLRLNEHTSNVVADLGQLEQVLINLAVNARDAMPGGGQVTISTGNIDIDEESQAMYGLPNTGCFVTITVSDTGLGMSPETKARVFEPFFTTKMAGRGTGLGLATVYGIVTQSGGHITVYSEEGVGTTFRVYLPATDDLAPANAGTAAGSIPGGSETILLVEDDAAVRGGVQAMLTKLGYHVLTAANGEEALRLASDSGSIDMVISDVVMPGLDGPTLVGLLRGAHPTTRALLVSGYAGDVIARHHVDHDDCAFLEKPFSLPVLAHKIREILDG